MMIGSNVLAASPCPLCGDRQAVLVATRDGKTKQALTTLECLGCGLGRIDPLPSVEALAHWYKTAYRQDYKNAVTPALRHVMRAGRNAIDRLDWLKAHTARHPAWRHESRSTVHTLDIGASSGEFVFLMSHLGFRARGIEPHQGYAEHAQQHLGLGVYHGPLQQQLNQFGAGELTMVSMFHVLEHLVDPLDTLRTIRSKLSTAAQNPGMLYIEVPNATRFCAPDYMFFRAHSLYFTAHTLRHMLVAAGFEVIHASAATDDNLSIVVQPGNTSHSLSVARPDGNALLAAQQQRKWPQYLWRQLLNGNAVQKMKRRNEEKASAAQFSSGKALLTHVYKNVDSGLTGSAPCRPTPVPAQARSL